MLGKPIFFDPTGKRARLLQALAWAAGTVSAVIFVLFTAILLVVNRPDDTSFDQQLSAHSSIRCAWAPTCSPAHAVADSNAADPELLKTAYKLASDLRERERGLRTRHPQAEVVDRHPIPAPLRGSKDRSLSIGFYVNWDDNSYPALKRALPHLDWVVPSWLSLEGPALELKADVDDRVLKLIQETKPDTPVLPMIQNAVEGKWDGAGLARLLADPTARAARIDEIVSFLETNKFQGLTIDFEEVPAKSQNDLQDFLRELSSAFAAHGLVMVLAVPFDDDSWPYVTYAKIADYMLLMGYDQHWDQSKPGSIAGEDWFENTLDKRMQELDPDRTILAIGGYGYDWVKGHQTQELTFEEAVLSAKDSEAKIEFDPKTANPHFSFIEDDGNRHDVWFLDGVTAFNEVEAGDAYRMAGYALWRVGSEDPSVWSVLGQTYGAPPPDDLREIGTSQDIDFEGRGEVLHVREEPAPGTRTFDIDHDTGQIVDETYKAVPTPFVIERTGTTPRKLALTFDDGPDPDWTPKILDILKAKGVHASFFVIGENAEANPDLVRRILAEGHDVGNHTFTHPNLGELPDSLVTLEINANQRLFEALTGRSMRLFRAPFLGDAEPTTSDEIVPIEIAQSMGYVTVGLHVDPNDWLRPPADTIVDRVIEQVSDPNPDSRGHIILLHDSGGDRSQTVAALPKLIDSLRAKGYDFVPVSELAGLTRDQAMPPLPPRSYAQLISLPVFMTLSWLGSLLTVVFVLAIGLGVARVLFLSGVGLGNRRAEARRVPPPLPQQPPLQTVLIPAHNESKVIAGAVHHILASDYPNLEVIVIDDGSTDDTSEQVQGAFRRRSSRQAVHHRQWRQGGGAQFRPEARARASRRRARRRHPFREGRDLKARALVRRSCGRCRGRQRQGRQPHQHDHALAGARICHQSEPRAPGACRAWLHHGRSRRHRRLETGGARAFGRLPARYARRGPGPDDGDADRWLHGALRQLCHWLDRSAGYGKGPRQAALPLGLRHAAMSVEVPQGDAQAALRRARSFRRAADLAVPVPAHLDRASRGPGADLAAHLRQPADAAASGSIRPRLLEEGLDLLSRVPADRSR